MKHLRAISFNFATVKSKRYRIMLAYSECKFIAKSNLGRIVFDVVFKKFIVYFFPHSS